MENLRDKFLRYLAQVTPYLPMQLEIAEAEGIYLTDAEGKKYMDLLSGVAVNNLGYRHPAIVRAIKKQAEKYHHLMVYGEWIQEETVLLAEKVIQLLGKPFEKVFFVNSGSEAIEGAIKLARLYTGKYEVVSFRGSYHGSTLATLNLIGDEKFRRPFRPLMPGIRILEFNNIHSLNQITSDTAAVVLETIQTASGMVVAEDAFLNELRKRCNETGTLIILDEIQTAIGRTGRYFSKDDFHFQPDIICLAKSLGGGLPLGAFAASSQIMDALNHEHPLLGHATTFGGNPVACAASLAFLSVLENEYIIETIPAKEQKFRELLKNPKIKEIRGKGLLLAMDLGDGELASRFVKEALKNGLITYWFLFNKQSLALIPPLIIEPLQIEEISLKINEILDKI